MKITPSCQETVRFSLIIFFWLSFFLAGCDQHQSPSASTISKQPDSAPVALETPLEIELDQVIQNNDTNRLIVLLNGGADPNSSDSMGIPDLYTAALLHRTEIAKIFLNKGANVNGLANFINGRKMTPLDIADKMGFDDIVTLLEQHGGKTSDQLGIDNTPKTSKVIFSKNSNGYDWQRADSQSKQQFCETTATAISKEFNRDFTADFYYNALDSFYNSSDANILNENIDQVVGLTTSAAIAGH